MNLSAFRYLWARVLKNALALWWIQFENIKHFVQNFSRYNLAKNRTPNTLQSVNVTNNSPNRDYSHPDNQTTQTTETPGFKPVITLQSIHAKFKSNPEMGRTNRVRFPGLNFHTTPYFIIVNYQPQGR